MSTEDISTHPAKQGDHSIHPQHVEHLVRHAVRNIKGADELCNKVFRRKKETTTRLPDDFNDETDGLKHFWN